MKKEQTVPTKGKPKDVEHDDDTPVLPAPPAGSAAADDSEDDPDRMTKSGRLSLEQVEEVLGTADEEEDGKKG
jgi:hypothetical protein